MVGNQAFLYYCRSDGLGFQYTIISQLLAMVNELGVSILIDWRNLSYFLSNRQSFIFERLHSYFRLTHPNLIYDPAEIDRIITQCPEKVIGVRVGKLFGQPNKIASTLESVLVSELYPDFGKKLDPLNSYLELRGKCEEKFNRFKDIAAHSIGIHARLGNGEVIENPIMRERANIEYDRFFREMDPHENRNFLVCTDTPSFLNACRERYGSRIVSMPRVMANQDKGTGHRNSKEPAPLPLDGYEQLGDALVEMLLLGECEQLICNVSLFSVHARVCKQVKSTILANNISDYSMADSRDFILS